MSESKKSNARLKFITTIFVGWASAVAICFSDVAVLNLVLVVVFAVCAVSIMLIRCENCSALLYRKDKKEHGFPTVTFLFPEMKCPGCGVERR